MSEKYIRSEYDNKSIMWGLRCINAAQNYNKTKATRGEGAGISKRVMRDFAELGYIKWDSHRKGWVLTLEGRRILDNEILDWY